MRWMCGLVCLSILLNITLCNISRADSLNPFAVATATGEWKRCAVALIEVEKLHGYCVDILNYTAENAFGYPVAEKLGDTLDPIEARWQSFNSVDEAYANAAACRGTLALRQAQLHHCMKHYQAISE